MWLNQASSIFFYHEGLKTVNYSDFESYFLISPRHIGCFSIVQVFLLNSICKQLSLFVDITEIYSKDFRRTFQTVSLSERHNLFQEC